MVSKTTRVAAVYVEGLKPKKGNFGIKKISRYSKRIYSFIDNI